MQNSLSSRKSDEAQVPKPSLPLRIYAGLLFSFCCMVIALSLAHLIFDVPLPWETASDRAQQHDAQQHEEWKKSLQYGKATADAIYDLAIAPPPALTDEQMVEFAQRFEEVTGEGDKAQRQYVEIASDIALAAVYGNTADNPSETLLGKARNGMLDPELDQRKMMILELQHLAQAALIARLQVTVIYPKGAKLEKAQGNFERTKKFLIATLREFSERYPTAPTH